MHQIKNVTYTDTEVLERLQKLRLGKEVRLFMADQRNIGSNNGCGVDVKRTINQEKNEEEYQIRVAGVPLYGGDVWTIASLLNQMGYHREGIILDTEEKIIPLEQILMESEWIARMESGERIKGTYENVQTYGCRSACKDFDLCAVQPEHLKPFFDRYFAYGEKHGFITLQEYWKHHYLEEFANE